MAYTLFIDESGDEGIEKEQIRRGASPFFFFGALLVENKHLPTIRSAIQSIEHKINRQGKGIHFNGINNHSKKVRCCKDFAKLPAIAFALLSDKKQLEKADYAKNIQNIKGGFYNKNAAYLLELVGKYCKEESINVTSIILEKKDNHNYSQLNNYLTAVKVDKKKVRTNLTYCEGWRHNAKYLKQFDFYKTLEAKRKDEEPVLCITDAIANALYKASIPDSLDITERRYIAELRDLFCADRNGLIFDRGIKAVINFDEMQLPTKTKILLKQLRTVRQKKFISSNAA